MNLRIETSSGTLQGGARAGHSVFLGIPYAKPPVGERRFSAPDPAEPWAGVRDATEFGAVAMQGTPFAAGMEVGLPQREDCLTLNVFTPGADGAMRPVLVWIHGGAFTVGASSMPLYDGGPLVERGDVVVVTLNYRLGLFGFLHLGDEGERFGALPNLAILDQIAALSWVRENIARFGGDPENVTLFGESAGASSVAALMIAPKARGLFRRAIAQSNALDLRLPSREHAERVTDVLLKKLGIARGQLEKLRALDSETLIRAQREAEVESLGWRAFFPVRHAESLPLDPIDAFADPAQPRIPLIVGSNRDEWNLFDAANIATWQQPLDPAEQEIRLSQLMPGAAREKLRALLDTYAHSRRALGLPHNERAVLRAIVGDLVFRMPGLRWAEAHARADIPVYVYLFTYASPALRGALGACHALDLPFVFGTYRQPAQERFAGASPRVESLSAEMMQAWLSFAREDRPSALPDWEHYDLARRPTWLFGPESALALDPLGDERAAWDALDAS